MRRNAIFAMLALALALPTLPGLARAGAEFEATDSFGDHGIAKGSFDRPVDVVRDHDENFYVVDQGNNRIEVFDRRGRLLRTWGGRGISENNFDLPSALAIDEGNSALYVADTRNNRVQKFDLSGKLLLGIGALGSGNGEFKGPTDVAVDGKGNLFVADPGNNRVQKFDSAGNFLSEWGKYSRRKGRGKEIEKPLALAWSDEGWGALYVVEADTCEVKKFDVDGVMLKSFMIHRKGEGLPCGQVRIRIEPRKYTVYISDTENDRILLYDRDGESLGEIREGRVPFRKPGGVFISTLFGEDVAVADTGNHLIQILRRRR
jgi:DNA-binding beta-propeller fold protein YncE